MEHVIENPEEKVSSADWAPEGATGQDPVTPKTGGTPLIEEERLLVCQTSGHLEGLTEKVSSLGLQQPKNNRCGAARKRAKRTRQLEAPTGARAGGQPQTTSGEPQILQGPGTSAVKGEGVASVGMKSPESEGHPQAQKQQRSAGGTPGGGQAKRPKQIGQLGYARATQEGVRVAVVGCLVLTQNPSPFWRGCDGDPSAAWDRPSSPCWEPNQLRRPSGGEEER
jgi:hypothetical protein